MSRRQPRVSRRDRQNAQDWARETYEELRSDFPSPLHALAFVTCIEDLGFDDYEARDALNEVFCGKPRTELGELLAARLRAKLRAKLAENTLPTEGRERLRAAISKLGKAVIVPLFALLATTGEAKAATATLSKAGVETVSYANSRRRRRRESRYLTLRGRRRELPWWNGNYGGSGRPSTLRRASRLGCERAHGSSRMRGGRSRLFWCGGGADFALVSSRTATPILRSSSPTERSNDRPGSKKSCPRSAVLRG